MVGEKVGEKPNTGQVVRIKRVVKQPVSAEDSKTQSSFQPLEGLTREQYESAARQTGSKIPYDMAVRIERNSITNPNNVTFIVQNSLDEIINVIDHHKQGLKSVKESASDFSEDHKNFDAVRKQYTALRTEYKSLQSELIKTMQAHNILKQGEANAKKQVVDLQTTLELEKEAHDETKIDRAAAQGELALMQKEAKVTYDEITALQQQYAGAVGTIKQNDVTIEELNKAFQLAHQNETKLEEEIEKHTANLHEAVSRSQEYSEAKEAELAALQTALKEYEAENEQLQLVKTDLEAALVSAKAKSTASLTDEEKDKQYQDEITALKEQKREELANAYDTVALLENRLHDYKLATAGGTIEPTEAVATEDSTEREAVQEGQEFSITPAYNPPDVFPYVIHPEFGLVTIEERDGAILRYQPAGNGCVFNVDSRRNIDVGKDYEKFVKIHESNLDAHIHGRQNKSTKSKLSGREKRALDSEE